MFTPLRCTVVFAVFALFLNLSCSKTPAGTTIEVDETDPVITLSGSTDTTIYVGDGWREPGFSGVDSFDGVLDDSVKVTGKVDTTREGVYPITYALTDEAGNKTTAERTVTVYASPSLWASYTFTGNAADSSGNNHHARVTAASLTSDRFGTSECAYEFSGVEGKYIVDTALADFSEGNCAKTIAGWIKTTSTANQTFFGIGSLAAGYAFQVAIGPGSAGQVVRVNGWGDSYDWRTSVKASTVCDGKWHHIAVTYDTTVTTVFVDGAEKARASTYRYRTNPKAAIVLIGNEIDYSGWPVKGSIDDVRIYTRALSSLQVAALYHLYGYEGDTTSTDTPPPDTVAVDKVTGLAYTITGTAGDLTLVLSWKSVPSAFVYGVYFDKGASVNKDGYYRVAMKNSYTFTPGALSEGETYTFAVTFTGTDDKESALSSSLTVEVVAP